MLAGTEKREAFLANAPATLQARRKEVEAAFGDKLAAARASLQKPLNAAEGLAIDLGMVVRALRLPPEDAKARVELGRWLQALYDEESQSRTARKVGKPAPAERDAAWLDKWVSDTGAGLMKGLKPEARAEVLRVWPVLYPDGRFKPPEAPAADPAAATPNAGTPNAPPSTPAAPAVAGAPATPAGGVPTIVLPDKPRKPLASNGVDYTIDRRVLEAEAAHARFMLAVQYARAAKLFRDENVSGIWADLSFKEAGISEKYYTGQISAAECASR